MSPSVLDELAFNFFTEFARCEYCLKAVGLRKNARNAEPDWRAFAAEVEVMDVIEEPQSSEIKTAIEYFLTNPPKKQIIVDGRLDWDEQLPSHRSKADLVLQLVCRVRNNLFHGGKFNGHWFAPQRSEDLIKFGLLLLKACIDNHSRVKEAYAQRAG